MPKKILIIDDNEDVANVLRLGLKTHGFECDAYTDPVKAVRDFKPSTYDLVLCDIKMPRMNGFHVFRELRQRDDSVTIYFLTSFEIYETEFSSLFLEVKVQRFLKKPISISDLVKEVRQVLVTVE